MSRASEAAALDARILAAIRAWKLSPAAFEALARDLFVHQVRYNAPYAAYAASLGFNETNLPKRAAQIPAVPASAFKESVLATFDERDAVLTFETSGTTQAQSGRHFFDTSALYDAALLAGFDKFMLPDRSVLRYLILVPARPTSSLGYMMRCVAQERGDGKGGWYFHEEQLDLERFASAMTAAFRDGVPVCVAGTAFAFAALLDALERERAGTLPAVQGSRIMETGGFKGRTRTLERSALYDELSKKLSIAPRRIVAEYGMTELTSQYYDAAWSRTQPERVKVGPPWLRALVVGADGREVAPGETGALRHIDLANRGSAISIQTEDLALRLPGEGFVLLGRDPQAGLRGCSLDAEDLIARRH